ncbi:MAG: hypothetical protein ABSE48_15655 [Verrucomicrobiota bacterium]|jgi:hypothetical protein
MSKRIDYEQTAAKLDYAALNKKLELLTQTEPPKNRNTALAMLEPLRDKLLALQRKGWSNQELADELKTAGVPVNAARLRECLNHWSGGGKSPAKRKAMRQPVVARSLSQPTAAPLPGARTPKLI